MLTETLRNDEGNQTEPSSNDRIFFNAVNGLLFGMDSVKILFNIKGNKPFRFKPDVNIKKLRRRGFNPHKMTKIVTHGWTNDEKYCNAFRNAYDLAGDVNFFCIDWGTLASVTNYLRAAMNAIDVGQFIGKFITLIELI